MIRFPGVGGVRRKGRERVIRMQRARRLASVAVIAILTISGLTACRQQPDVAVYFGNNPTILVSDVQAVFDNAQDRLQAVQDAALQQQADGGGAQPSEPPAAVQVPITGPDIVGVMVGNDIAMRLARPGNVTLPAELPLAEAGQALALPADARYLKLYVENRLLFNQLMQKAKPVTPAEADIRHIYDVIEATGQMHPGVTYEQFKSGVSPQAMQTLGAALAVRNEVQAQLDQLNVKVNPRYETARIDILTEAGPDNKPLPLVSVPLADTADAAPVTDAA
jgi:hypothetical protein